MPLQLSTQRFIDTGLVAAAKGFEKCQYIRVKLCHSREGGNPLRRGMDSRLRGNDESSPISGKNTKTG